MQKFVVIKSAKTAAQNAVTSANVSQIRMSGYLKKKRKKMGGWRKLWFVLQNRLLLSYSSKEDCERKLAPFKDVVSLVPGTIIKPGKGFRFIIETTTNIIYTYRCDDSKTCSEWMAALVECLSTGNQLIGQHMQNQSKYHFSLDNLPIKSQPKRPIKSSQSWDSIIYQNKNTKSSPNLPMAQVTAKILEKSGLHNGVPRNDDFQKEVFGNEKVQNFRLHQNIDLAMAKQSHEVCRINSMFKRYDLSVNRDRPTDGIAAVAEHNIANSNIANANIMMNNNKIKSDQPVNDRQNNMIIDSNQNKRNVEKCGNCLFEEKIRRLSLLDDILETSRLPSKNLSDTFLETKNLYEPKSRQSPSSTSNLSEPIYAVVDLKSKHKRRANIKDMQERLEKERPRSCNVASSDYEEVLQFQNYIGHNEDENENIYEPIAIPELSPKSPMWRYFPKINIEALIEITKKKNNQEPSTFYDIRKRWGNHRKSIKNRMKKLYSKEPKEIPATSNSLSDDDLGSQAASCSTSASSSGKSSSTVASRSTSVSTSSCSDRSKSKDVCNESSQQNGIFEKSRKGEKCRFSSLGRLKKSRTSLFFDELSPRKKLITVDDVEFQKELKKELVKRNDSMKKMRIILMRIVRKCATTSSLIKNL